MNFKSIKKEAEKLVFTLENGQVVRRTIRRFGNNASGERFSELQKEGIYVAEIKGILYYVSFTNGNGFLVRKPEEFRKTKTNSLKRSGRKSSVLEDVKEYKTKRNVKTETEKVVEFKVEFKEVETKETKTEEVKHKEYETIKTCIENDIPVYLVGDAGTGKNYTLEQISWDLGLDFYFTNSVQQEYKLTGFIDAGGNYHETEFYKAFKNGGIFFLDEIDASIPEVLILLNAAIANRYFEFPIGRIEAHKNFRVVAAGNTVGSGASEQYTGRLVLDQATLDRFVIIEFDYDERVEMNLAKGDKELVDFVHDLRNQAREMGIRATFSYRCIITVTKLKKVMDLQKILTIAVFKGLDKDTVNCFKPKCKNKYTETLNRIQAA